MDRAMAPFTRKTYQKIVCKFAEFCLSMDVDMTNAEAVELWVAHLSGEEISHGVIVKSHISTLA